MKEIRMKNSSKINLWFNNEKLFFFKFFENDKISNIKLFANKRI